jgi:hypothetical protein
MRKGTIQKIEEEINEKRKMPKEVKESLRKEIFTNIIICACLVAYFLFLFLGSVDKTKAVRVIDLKIFSTIYLATSIILFEIAYKKDSGKIAIHGIEILLVAIMTLFLPYIIFELDSKYQKIYYFVGEYIAVYYVIKCICIAIIRKRKYSKDVSDIKEIIKKEKRIIKDENEEIIEKPKSVAKSKNEESKKESVSEKTKRKTTKKKTEPKKEVKENKSKKIENEKNEKIKEQKNTEKKNTTKPKATTKATKKETVSKEPKTTTKKKVQKEIATKKEEAPKRRGRPKKQETIEKEETKAKVEEPKQENAPKKRGRPRKVVTQ